MDNTLRDSGGAWRRCRYEIVTEAAGKGKVISLIAPVPGSLEEPYFPLKHGREDYWKEGYGKEKHQREKPDGPDRSPHIALANLDISDEKAICNFCSNYGLLGLRKIPAWQKKEPPNKNLSHSRCEPLELFREAAGQYRDLVCWVKENQNHDIAALDMTLLGLEGCTPYPLWHHGKWHFAWSFRSLLEACYLMVTLDLTEGKGEYRLCNYDKCKQIFLAHKTQRYCSSRCRHNHTSDNIPPKVLRAELMEKRKAGLITVEQRKAAYDFIKGRWDNRDRSVRLSEEQFRAEVERFLLTTG